MDRRNGRKSRCARVVCAALSWFMLCSSVAPLYVTAEEPATEPETAVPVSASEDTLISYAAYCQQNASVPAAAEEIILSGTACEVQGAVTQDAGAAFGEGIGAASWTVTVPADALYTVRIDYEALEGAGANMFFGLQADGVSPYDEAVQFLLTRLWENDGPTMTDGIGNEFAPDQKQLYQPQTAYMRDSNGFYNDPLQIRLNAGEHRLTLTGEDAFCRITEVRLVPPAVSLPYAQASAAYPNTPYAGKEIVIEGEDAARKSSRSLIPLSDGSDVSVQPNDPYIAKLNYIGGNNWKMNGDTLTWDVTVSESGLYKIGFCYRQNYVIGGTSYRRLLIDGKEPFAEAASLAFPYSTGWTYTELAADGDALPLYLEAGPHTLSLQVTLGEMSTFSGRLKALTDALGTLYREIVMITGETPDSNRDYALFSHIPNLEQRLNDALDEIAWLEAESYRINGKDGDSNVAVLKKIRVTVEQMLKRRFEAQKKKNAFYDGYASLSAWLYEAQNMALDIDAIVLAAPQSKVERGQASLWAQFTYSVQRLIGSFIYDYSTISGGGEDATEHLTLWVNWSREQAMVLNNLIATDFTPKEKIDVTVRVTNASLLQAILSGNGPDCSLSVSRTLPVNLAMRGSLCELSRFDGYDEMLTQFIPNACEPYMYKGGCYALPSTQQFYMMFYRTDVFRELELKAPTTWDEFREVSSILMMNNLQIGLPYSEITDMGQVDGGVSSLSIFPSLLAQKGLSLYNPEQTKTVLTSDIDVMQTFVYWTDFYTEYGLPKSYNFFNHFRTGLMPLAIQNYTTFATLEAAAPGIKGKWKMVPIPGFAQEDGSVNNAQTGFGNGAVILKMTEAPEAAWKLLKWWCGESTQARYAANLESVIGVSSRYSTANVEALKSLGWTSETWRSLKAQWDRVEELPELPGGYYVARAIDQAYWNVTEIGAGSKDMLLKWGKIADDEIERKINQYTNRRGTVAWQE